MAPAVVPTADRELWDPAVQALEPAQVEAGAAAAIAREWARIWDAPLPFYRDKFAAAGLGPDTVPPLDEIPRTTKQELRADEAAHPPLGTHRSVPLERAVRIATSGGTTGNPTFIFYGERDWAVQVETSIRNLWRYGVRPGDRFSHPWPQGLYPTGVTAGRQYLDLGVLEIAVGPPFTREVAADHLRLWDMLRPDAFMFTGHQLMTYEDVGREVGIDFAAIVADTKVGFIEAACQFEGPRRRVEDHYGFRLHNLGGASDVPGFGTSDCRFHSGLHAPGDHVRLQVCDPHTGREVPSGERGTLVVTAFDLDALVIRYDVEDVVVASTGPCPCGETGPRYTLLGRAADTVVVDGHPVLPMDVQLALDAHGAPEFQVATTAPASALHVRVETDGDGRDEQAILADALGIAVEVEPVGVATLPRATFKPRRVSD
jgi:phenylacetate-CoA ligase